VAVEVQALHSALSGTAPMHTQGHCTAHIHAQALDGLWPFCEDRPVGAECKELVWEPEVEGREVEEQLGVCDDCCCLLAAVCMAVEGPGI